MRHLISALFIGLLVLFYGFRGKNSSKIVSDTGIVSMASIDVKPVVKTSEKNGKTTEQVSGFVDYAKSLIGTPYSYGSANPDKGLDCSGFVNCVSDHCGIKVPRSSVDFTNFGKTIETGSAKPGDLILFTGTDPSRHIVGHIGIITDNLNGNIHFIHSSSGKVNGVTISDLSDYYKTRFVKVIRIFPTAADKIAA